MKVVLAPVGTRGDVQPMLALGLALQERGHTVRMCAAENYQSWAEDLGIEFRACGRDVSAIMQRRDGGTALVRQLGSQIEEQMTALLDLCRGADALVGAMLQMTGASVARKLGLPYFYSLYQPLMLASRHHPGVGVPWERPPQWFNALYYKFWPLVWNLYFRKPLNRARSAAGLEPVRDVYPHFVYDAHLLLAFDTELAPPPPELQGVPHTRANFWFLPGGGALPPDVEEFLAAGPPPVYIGFGSMKSGDPETITRTLVDAAQGAGVRSLISSGWAGLGGADLPHGCKMVGPLDHAALFPRVAAVVHHGGAGTTAAAARAGTPQVVVPHFGDQFYWGHRVRALGVGAAPIRLGRLNARRLAAALAEVMGDAAVRERARALGKRLHAADGLGPAVAAIERGASAEHRGES